MKIPCRSRCSLQRWSSKHLASRLRRQSSLPQLQLPSTSILPCKCRLPVPSSPLHPRCPPLLSCPSSHIPLVRIRLQRHHHRRNTIRPEFVDDRVITQRRIQLCLGFRLLDFSNTPRSNLPSLAVQSMSFCLRICLSWLVLNSIQPIRILRNFADHLFVHCWSPLYLTRINMSLFKKFSTKLYLCISITMLKPNGISRSIVCS
jgi:hypothetical protein